MAKWRHLRMSYGDGFESIVIFPASRVQMDWVFERFPKTKKGKSDRSTLVIEVEQKDLINVVEEAILNYLEENGWEGYAYVPNWKTQSFKRLEDNG